VSGNSGYTRLMVTGASGFIGRHLLNFLLALPKGPVRIIALDKKAQCHAPSSPRIEQVICDLTEPRDVQNVFRKTQPDGIIHLAGRTTGSDLSRYIAVNVLGCENILSAAAQRERPPRLLITGSAAEYGLTSGTYEVIDEQRPLQAKTAYGISKIMQEKWALLYYYEKALPVICVRPFNVIGPGQSAHLVPATFLYQIAEVLNGNAHEVCVGNINTARDFIDVKDLVAAFWALMNAGAEAEGEVFNISSGQPIKIADILDACIALSGQQMPVRQDPHRLKAYDVPVIIGDNSKLRRFTGWQCKISWQDSLAAMWDDIRSTEIKKSAL